MTTIKPVCNKGWRRYRYWEVYQRLFPVVPQLPLLEAPLAERVMKRTSHRIVEWLPETFHWPIPDFVPADRDALNPYVFDRCPSPWHCLRWAAHLAALNQGRSRVALPYITLKGILSNVTQPVRPSWDDELRHLLAIPEHWRFGCPAGCPGVGVLGVQHMHYLVGLNPCAMGILGEFAVGTEKGVHRFEFPPLDPLSPLAPFAARLWPGQRHRLARAYLPLLMFGQSPAVGLKFLDWRLLQVLVRETTLDEVDRGRPDGAVVFQGGTVCTGETGSACPFLDPARSYVAFNGNALPELRGWPLTSGLADEPFLHHPLDSEQTGISRLTPGACYSLKTLGSVARRFGLTAAVYHQATGGWSRLSDLKQRAKKGQAVEGYSLRIYTEDNYLIRWRAHFAERLGYATIPDVRPCPA